MSSSPDPAARLGLWLVGARGSVATTVAVGAAALAQGMVGGVEGAVGLVTGLTAFAGAGLPGVDSITIGGWDVSGEPLRKRAEQLEEGGVIPRGLAHAVGDRLGEVDDRIVAGLRPEDVVASPAAALTRLRADLEHFAARTGVDTVVVVNVASTEPPMAAHPAHERADTLLAAIEADEPVLSAGGMYALAAVLSGAAYVDFTPGMATTLPAIAELSSTHGAVLAGRDGKTGETLLKTALAPMFADRALRVRSWSGMNLLGGGDGATLADPASATAKLASKAQGLEAILGHQPEGPVRIDHVADLGDWKTAWDLITFEGFLGTRMQLQFTWQGCDSALAAPLILDLARLCGAAMRAGRTGPQPALGYFFKAPIGSDEHRLDRQFTELVRWADGLGG